ncbi:hypothetical protein RchiOBHm_Chr5g0049201 [Rosa chinensis]|uniref:Uncharacterized protein n=1 Tax=Rosa chinensis TaxID=74649 RepID=A0A2P6QEU4_ROSCH|nr:uncharacterized protein LOC112202508 [Rosa chinensis]PRQ32687.1 hypothetical protein RchiOBHm_Chr5g0049201 [Rosa chinensis]
MTRKALLESPPTMKRRVGEVAGGAAAECAAVCCCCPCSMMNLLVLAFYKLPRGLCRKASAKIKKKRRCKKGLLPRPRPTGDGDFKTTVSGGVHDDDCDKKKNDDAESDGAAFEKEMWDRFYGNGFWRSASSNNKET